MAINDNVKLEDDILNFLNEITFKRCDNEEELRIEFQNQLNIIARTLDLTKTHLIFKNETRLKEGRSDFLYGNTIIEYKRYNRLSNDTELSEAIKQLKEYSSMINLKIFKCLVLFLMV